jgi:hypothetical protein
MSHRDTVTELRRQNREDRRVLGTQGWLDSILERDYLRAQDDYMGTVMRANALIAGMSPRGRTWADKQNARSLDFAEGRFWRWITF